MSRYNLSPQFEDYLMERADFENMANREEEYVREGMREMDEQEAMEDARENDGVPGPREYPDREDRDD